MNKAELVFKTIDIFCDLPQNAVRFPGVIRIEDIPYSSVSKEYTVGDLYFKREILNDGNKHPLLLYIHGGGFIEGDKEYRVTNSEYYADKGFFVFNINHRMPPDIVLPDNINDCIDALNYINTLAENYNIDTNRIVISGDSSGAYETSMISACIFDEELRLALGVKKADLKPAAIALMCGLYDLHKLMDGTKILGIMPTTCSMLFGFELDRKMSNRNEYENIDYISSINFVNENWCPVFITWTANDFLCVDQGEPFAKKLEEQNVRHCIFKVDGLRNIHCYHLNLYRKTSKKCMNTCVNFLYDVLNMPYEKLPTENLVSENVPENPQRKEKFDSLKESSKEKFSEIKESGKDKFEEIKESSKNKFSEIKEKRKKKE